VSAQTADCICRGGGRGGHGRGRKGRGGNECVRADAARVRSDASYIRTDAGVCLHGLIFTNADGQNRLRINSHPRGKCGRAQASGRKGRPDGKFYRRTSV
jgi:hypothetical protein